MDVSGSVAVLVTVGFWLAVITLLVRLLVRRFRGPARSRVRAWWTLGVVSAVAVLALAYAPSQGRNSTIIGRQTGQIHKP